MKLFQSLNIETENTILKSIEIFEKIFISENYQDVACIEANKLIKEIEILLNKKTFSENFMFTWVNFISIHFFNILSILKNESISSLENQRFLERIYNLKLNPNPIHSVKWYVNQTETTYDREHIEELTQKGYVIVQVYHIPDDRGYGVSNFLFAEDEDKNQFYLSVYNFDDGWNRWGFIKQNSKLAIKYTKLQTNGKPTPAEEIVEIEQY